MSNYYARLQVDFRASMQDIKAAYKRLAMRYHPDKNPGKPEAEETFKQINAAYQVLSNPEKRKAYDYRLLFLEAEKRRRAAEIKENRRAYAAVKRKYVRRTEVVPPGKNEIQRIHLFAVLAFFALILLCWRGYFFMETFTAKTWTEKAKEAYQNGEYARAQSFLDDAFLHAKDIPETNYLKAVLEIYVHKNYEKGRRFMSYAITFAQKKHDAAPGDYHFQRAYANYQLKNYAEATKELQNISPETKALGYRIALLQGEIFLYGNKQYDKALRMYQMAAASDTLRHEATLGKAVAMHYKGAYQASNNLLYLAYLQQPTDGRVNYYRALNLIKEFADTLNACFLLEKAYEQGVKQAVNAHKKYCRTKE